MEYSIRSSLTVYPYQGRDICAPNRNNQSEVLLHWIAVD